MRRSRTSNVDYHTFDADRIDNLEKVRDPKRFEYASRDHITVAILWHTGIRLGSLRAFDVGDFDRDGQCLDLRHRPETGTALKNKKPAERSIAVGPHYCTVLEDYLEHNRHDVTGDTGRRPLITSTQGRLSQNAIRETIYRVTHLAMSVSARTTRIRRPASIAVTASVPAVRAPDLRTAFGGAPLPTISGAARPKRW